MCLCVIILTRSFIKLRVILGWFGWNPLNTIEGLSSSCVSLNFLFFLKRKTLLKAQFIRHLIQDKMLPYRYEGTWSQPSVKVLWICYWRSKSAVQLPSAPCFIIAVSIKGSDLLSILSQKNVWIYFSDLQSVEFFIRKQIWKSWTPPRAQLQLVNHLFIDTKISPNLL